MNSNVEQLASVCTKHIQDGLSSYLTSITSCVTSEAQQELTVDSLLRVMEEVSKDLEKRNLLIPPRREDIKIDLHRDKVFKITYKDQLNSIEFITDKEETKTMLVTASSRGGAEFKAKARLSSGVTILSSEFDHEELDSSRVNIDYAFRPVISVDHVAVTFTVAV